jgi:hypothetical protein
MKIFRFNKTLTKEINPKNQLVEVVSAIRRIKAATEQSPLFTV